jgi:hypothetical protein
MPQPDAFAVVSSMFVDWIRFGLVTRVQVSKQMETVENSLKDLGTCTGTNLRICICCMTMIGWVITIFFVSGVGFSPALASASSPTSSSSPSLKSQKSPPLQPAAAMFSPPTLLLQLLQPPPSGWTSRKSSRIAAVTNSRQLFCDASPGELFEMVILHGCQMLDVCDMIAKRGDGKHKIPFVAYNWSWDSDLKSLSAGRGLGEAAWRITCASVLSVDPSSKTVTQEQMQMVLSGVTRLNEAMFWVQDSVKEGRASAAVAKLRADVQEKLHMLIGQSDAEGGSTRRRSSIDGDAADAGAAVEGADMNAAALPAPPPRSAAASPTPAPPQPFNTGFIACTLLVLLQAWKKQESARHPSATDIFANLSMASRRCLIYGCKDLLLDDNGAEIFGVVMEDGAVFPLNSTPLPDPNSMNWREWAVVLQHPGLLQSLTSKKLGAACMMWMLAQVLTVNTIKNDSQWLPEGFATSGYVFADFSSSSSAAASTESPAGANDNDFFLVSSADAHDAIADGAVAACNAVVAAACERDLMYADSLGVGFRTILLAGKSAVESALLTRAPFSLPLHAEADVIRGGDDGDCVRMAIGMEEGPGRRRRKLKLVAYCGEYSYAKEARNVPNEIGIQRSEGQVTADAVVAGDEAADDSFASLMPAGFSPTKKRPSLSV